MSLSQALSRLNSVVNSASRRLRLTKSRKWSNFLVFRFGAEGRGPIPTPPRPFPHGAQKSANHLCISDLVSSCISANRAEKTLPTGLYREIPLTPARIPLKRGKFSTKFPLVFRPLCGIVYGSRIPPHQQKTALGIRFRIGRT